MYESSYIHSIKPSSTTISLAYTKATIIRSVYGKRDVAEVMAHLSSLTINYLALFPAPARTVLGSISLANKQ